MIGDVLDFLVLLAFVLIVVAGALVLLLVLLSRLGLLPVLAS